MKLRNALRSASVLVYIASSALLVVSEQFPTTAGTLAKIAAVGSGLAFILRRESEKLSS